MHLKKIWDKWEVIAIKYLQKHKYHIKDTNFKFGRFWEIDIIAEKDKKYYFFEVKYRNNTLYGTPEESITKHKLYKCLKTVEYYCKKNYVSLENIQFDVIAILKWEKSHRVTHYKNVEIG